MVRCFCFFLLVLPVAFAGGPPSPDKSKASPTAGSSRFARIWSQLVARRKWKSDRTPGKGEMYHWVKWPHAGLANLVTGRGEGEKYEGPVQYSGHYVRGIAGTYDDRKQFLDKTPRNMLAKVGDEPMTVRTGGLPVPCDTPFKCKARLRDKQVSCCQICPDELYLPPDRYYGANEHVERDPYEPFTRDVSSALAGFRASGRAKPAYRRVGRACQYSCELRVA